MTSKFTGRPALVLGPSGQSITIDSLPPRETKRWHAWRKAVVVAAVRGGLLSLEEVRSRYTLSVEEFQSWQRLFERHGLAGLRATRIQDYRKDQSRERNGGETNSDDIIVDEANIG